MPPARCRGRSPSAMGGRCRTRRSRPGAGRPRVSPAARSSSSSGRSSTAWQQAAPTSRRWKARRPEAAAASRVALNSSPAIVEIRNLGYAVGGRAIFDGLDVDIVPGKITAIMGPSGTGKTTLLRLITGQVRADSGTVTVAGEDMTRLRGDALYRLRKRMGMLFQNGALLTDLTVFENVAFPLREHTNLPERLIRQLVLIKLQAVRSEEHTS